MRRVPATPLAGLPPTAIPPTTVRTSMAIGSGIPWSPAAISTAQLTRCASGTPSCCAAAARCSSGHTGYQSLRQPYLGSAGASSFSSATSAPASFSLTYPRRRRRTPPDRLAEIFRVAPDERAAAGDVGYFCGTAPSPRPGPAPPADASAARSPSPAPAAASRPASPSTRICASIRSRSAGRWRQSCSSLNHFFFAGPLRPAIVYDQLGTFAGIRTGLDSLAGYTSASSI